MSELTVVIPETNPVELPGRPEVIQVEIPPESNTETLVDFALEIGSVKLSIEQMRTDTDRAIEKYTEEFNRRLSELSNLINDLTVANFEAAEEMDEAEEVPADEIVIEEEAPEVAAEVTSRKRFFL